MLRDRKECQIGRRGLASSKNKIWLEKEKKRKGKEKSNGSKEKATKERNRTDEIK